MTPYSGRRPVAVPFCTECRCPLGYDPEGQPICPNCPDPDDLEGMSSE